jgi:hypothetical protein
MCLTFVCIDRFKHWYSDSCRPSRSTVLCCIVWYHAVLCGTLLYHVVHVHAVLCCKMLFYAYLALPLFTMLTSTVLYHSYNAVLCCTMLYPVYSVSSFPMLSNAFPCFTMLHYSVLYCTMLHHAVQCGTLLKPTVPYCTMLSILYPAVPCCIKLCHDISCTAP